MAISVVSFAAWSLYGVVSTAQNEFALELLGSNLPLVEVLFWNFVSMWLWAVVTVAVVLVVRRHRLRPGLRLRHMTTHVGLFLVAWVFESLLFAVMDGRGSTDLGEVLALMLSLADVDLVAYLAVLALTYLALARFDLTSAREDQLLVQAARDRAEVLAFRMQLQPHFIFNALHAVLEVLERNPKDAGLMLRGLEDILRHTEEEAGREEVALGRELQLAASYLDIQKVRFGAALGVEMEVPAGLGSALVPSFLLQPLVENAVVHGVSKCSNGGVVRIGAWAEESALVIEVTNDSVPLLGGAATRPREGMGLGNTRGRLHGLYGPASTLTLSIDDTGLASTRVRLPLHRIPLAPMPGQASEAPWNGTSNTIPMNPSFNGVVANSH